VQGHGLRSTFASIAEELVSSALLKRMMNHAATGDVTLGGLGGWLECHVYEDHFRGGHRAIRGRFGRRQRRPHQRGVCPDHSFQGSHSAGVLTASVISATIGRQLRGPGTIYLGQNLRFRAPVRPGETVCATVTVKEVMLERGRVTFNTVSRSVNKSSSRARPWSFRLRSRAGCRQREPSRPLTRRAPS
jgi:hypothetical protein